MRLPAGAEQRTFFIFFLLFFLFHFPVAQAKNKNKTKGPLVYKLLTEGSQLAIEDKYEKALEKFRQAERLMPGYGITLYLIGKCYNAMKQYEKGLDYSKRSEKTGKFPSDLYLNIAISYARLQQWEQSRKYTQLFLSKEKDPEMILAGKMMLDKVNKQIKRRDDAQAEQDAGIRDYQKKDYMQALLHFQRADRIASKNGHLPYLIGLCLNGLGQYQKALSHFQQSGGLGYTPKDLTFQIALAKANLGKYRGKKGFRGLRKRRRSPSDQERRQKICEKNSGL